MSSWAILFDVLKNAASPILLPVLSPVLPMENRRIKRMHPLEDAEANFASPEDVIIKKMEYYKEGSSEKHIRDILGMLKISGDLIDPKYISLWAETLNLDGIWKAIQERLLK